MLDSIRLRACMQTDRRLLDTGSAGNEAHVAQIVAGCQASADSRHDAGFRLAFVSEVVGTGCCADTA